MGLSSAWIDRRHGAEGWGATMPPTKEPTYLFHVNSLNALAKAHADDR
jgi:2-haloacid dehalogenase